MLMYTLALLATCCAVVTDLRTRTIPNAIPGVLFLAAGVLTALGHHPLGWSQAVLGLVVASCITLPLFRRGWFGGGDTKLMMALGLTLGLQPFLVFCAACAVAGGALALALRGRGEREMAYAPAMLLGLLAFIPMTLAG